MGKMSSTWPTRLFCLSNLKYMKVTQNIYLQSLGNLEVIGVHKTACFAHMTSRSCHPEFNYPLEKAVDLARSWLSISRGALLKNLAKDRSLF